MLETTLITEVELMEAVVPRPLRALNQLFVIGWPRCQKLVA